MSARGFAPLGWAAGVAAATLGCYLVSLKVASERAALDKVETEILLAQRDIRLLNTEIGTRGRLAQLERWNARVIRLAAPEESQFVESGFQLAALVVPERASPVDAPVVLASAPAPRPPAAPLADAAPTASGLMHTASLTLPTRSAPATNPAPRTEGEPAPAPTGKATAEPAKAPAKAPAKSAADKPSGKAPDKPSGKAASSERKPAAAKPAKTAMADPLAPLPGAGSKGKAAPAAAGARPSAKPAKDPGSRQ